MSVKGGGSTPQIRNLFLVNFFFRKGGGTPLTDKIRKVVFDVAPKYISIFLNTSFFLSLYAHILCVCSCAYVHE